MLRRRNPCTHQGEISITRLEVKALPIVAMRFCCRQPLGYFGSRGLHERAMSRLYRGQKHRRGYPPPRLRSAGTWVSQYNAIPLRSGARPYCGQDCFSRLQCTALFSSSSAVLLRLAARVFVVVVGLYFSESHCVSIAKLIGRTMGKLLPCRPAPCVDLPILFCSVQVLSTHAYVAFCYCADF